MGHRGAAGHRGCRIRRCRGLPPRPSGPQPKLRGGHLDHYVGPARRSPGVLRDRTPTGGEAPGQAAVGETAGHGRRAAKPVQWREGSRSGTGRSDFKRMYSRLGLRIRPGTARVLAAGRVARRPGRSCSVLALGPSRRHPADHPGPGPPGQAPLAHRTRVPRDETGPGPGPLRGPHLQRVAPPRQPRLRRACLLHFAATGQSPKRQSTGRTARRSPTRSAPASSGCGSAKTSRSRSATGARWQRR